jgi:hypothetical protein
MGAAGENRPTIMIGGKKAGQALALHRLMENKGCI